MFWHRACQQGLCVVSVSRSTWHRHILCRWWWCYESSNNMCAVCLADVYVARVVSCGVRQSLSRAWVP